MMEGIDSNARQILKSLVAKLDRLSEEKAVIDEAIKETFQEVKDRGFDVKVLKQALKMRKIDPADLEQQDALLDLYRSVLEV